MTTITIELTLEIDVDGDYVPGLPGNREEPEEPAHFVARRVKLGKTDITALLSDADMEAIEEACLEQEEEFA